MFKPLIGQIETLAFVMSQGAQYKVKTISVY